MTEQELASTRGALIDKAERVWRKAQVVHKIPASEGWPEARAIAEEAARHPEYESSLFELLDSPSQLVVAYSLLTLELMGSRRLKNLPAELLTNRSNITLMIGSIRTGMDLGGWAREIQKRAEASP